MKRKRHKKYDTPEKLLTTGSFFNLQRFADEDDEFDYAINPSTQTATVGKDFLLWVNGKTGTDNFLKVSVPEWVLVGGQRGLGLSLTAEEIDTTHKTSGGWGSGMAGIKKWSIDLDSLVLRNEKGYKIIEEAFEYGLEVNIKIEYPVNPNDSTEVPHVRIGWGFVVDDSLTANHNGEASSKRKINGNGPLTRRMPEEPYENHLKQLMTKDDYAEFIKQ